MDLIQLNYIHSDSNHYGKESIERSVRQIPQFEIKSKALPTMSTIWYFEDIIPWMLFS